MLAGKTVVVEVMIGSLVATGVAELGAALFVVLVCLMVAGFEVVLFVVAGVVVVGAVASVAGGEEMLSLVSLASLACARVGGRLFVWLAGRGCRPAVGAAVAVALIIGCSLGNGLEPVPVPSS